MIERLGIQPKWQSAELQRVPSLLKHQLHLWWLPLELTEKQKAHALKLLSELQREKYERRRSDALKEAYLAGRYLLLNLLGAYTNTAPNELELSYTRLSKPFLSNPSQNLQFNFTDTTVNDRSVGVFAFALSHDLGVDIEAKQRRSNFIEIAKRRFTHRELEYVYDDGKLNSEKFLAIWTRKEAFGKATGQGINFKMNTCDLASDNRHELKFFDDDRCPWRLLQIELGDDFIASVVHAGHQILSITAFNYLES